MRRLAFVLFLLLPVVYCVLVAPYGFNDTDQGFVQALSWRILNGQIPYLDFDYVRPPLTPYLHAAEMWLLPAGYEVLGARCIMYLMMWGSVLFTAFSFAKVFKWQPDLRFWLIAATAFIFTAHNYPPMPWHTIDGVFFAAMGGWLLTRSPRFLPLMLAMFVLVLSALCKQPFAVLPVLAPLTVLFLYGKRAALFSVIGLAVSGVIVTGILLLIHPRFPGEMLTQILGAGGSNDLLQAGLFRYGWGFLLALPMIVVSILPPVMRRWAGWVMPGLVVITAMGMHVWRASVMETWVEPSFYFFQALLVTAVFHAGRMLFFRRDKNWAIPLLLLAGAWASSISWGYQTPVLFAAPLWITVMLMFSGETQLRLPVALHAGLLCLTFATYFFLNQFPYREEPRSVAYVSLGAVEPKLQGIYAGPSEAKLLSQIRDMETDLFEISLATYMGKPSVASWTVIPSMPLVHYLHDRMNPLRSDWEHNAEMASGLKEEDWMHQLNQRVKTVYIEKDKMTQMKGTAKYECGRCEVLLKSPWQQTDPDPFSPFFIYLNFESPR